MLKLPWLLTSLRLGNGGKLVPHTPAMILRMLIVNVLQLAYSRRFLMMLVAIVLQLAYSR